LAVEHSIDFTHILEVVLDHWEELEALAPEDAVQYLEKTLKKLLNRKIERIDYAEFSHAVRLLFAAAIQMRKVLEPLLNPVIREIDPRYRPLLALKRYHMRCPVLELRIVER
jgi:predicted nucleic acid-binding protein